MLKTKIPGKKKTKRLTLPKEVFEQSSATAAPPRDLDSKACVTIGEKNFEMKADDLEQISELGRGAYGVVDKMRHVPSGLIMAVKGDVWICMELMDTSLDKFYKQVIEKGMAIPEDILGKITVSGDVWICMELMDTSLDKFYKQVIEKGMAIPEDILGKITVSIVKALEHLHSRLSVIHRGDVKSKGSAQSLACVRHTEVE
ncbi:UNVERIFIED_CONTAM: hypothetical protein FKN15_052369 [Acipenser sinensis]